LNFVNVENGKSENGTVELHADKTFTASDGHKGTWETSGTQLILKNSDPDIESGPATRERDGTLTGKLTNKGNGSRFRYRLTRTESEPAREKVGPTIVERRTITWDGSKENYASCEEFRFSVGIGNSNGWGFGHAGVLLENVRRLELDTAISKKLKRLDDDSFAGFIVDYHTSSGFVSRVALSTGLHTQKRGDTNPWWGKSSVPDLYIGVGKLRTYTLDLQKWAPPDWDGQCWFSVNIENSGANTSFQAHITKMIGRDDDKHPAEVVDATPANLSMAGKWRHSAGSGNGPGMELTFFSNGRIGRPEGPATWSLNGRNLTMRWPGRNAPNGAWVDRCVVSPDGKSYLGKNQKGAVIRGTRID
jgi:hypothetical protein